MGRRLFTVAWAVSLLLSVGMAGLWVDSLRGQDWMWLRVGRRIAMLGGAGGQVGVIAAQAPDVSNFAERPVGWSRNLGGESFTDSIDPTQSNQWKAGDFGCIWNVKNYGAHVFALVAPAWLVVTVLALLPGAVAVARVRRRDPDRMHRCRRCGYDLRASPHRCPECGTAVPTKTQATA